MLKGSHRYSASRALRQMLAKGKSSPQSESQAGIVTESGGGWKFSTVGTQGRVTSPRDASPPPAMPQPVQLEFYIDLGTSAKRQDTKSLDFSPWQKYQRHLLYVSTIGMSHPTAFWSFYSLYPSSKSMDRTCWVLCRRSCPFPGVLWGVTGLFCRPRSHSKKFVSQSRKKFHIWQ